MSLLPVLLVLIANALGLNNTELTVILGEGEEFAPGTLARAMRMKTMLNVAEITAGIMLLTTYSASSACIAVMRARIRIAVYMAPDSMMTMATGRKLLRELV